MKKTNLNAKQKKNLELKIETVRDLRTLDHDALAQVAGGLYRSQQTSNQNCTTI